MYETKSNTCLSLVEKNSLLEWHLSNGHVNFTCLKDMAKNNTVKGLTITKCNDVVCENDSKAKIIVKPSEASEFRAKAL